MVCASELLAVLALIWYVRLGELRAGTVRVIGATQALSMLLTNRLPSHCAIVPGWIAQ